MSCNYTRETRRGVHECVQDNCDGVNHYTEFYPYMKETRFAAVAMFMYSAVLGVVAGILLGNWFGVFLWN